MATFLAVSSHSRERQRASSWEFFLIRTLIPLYKLILMITAKSNQFPEAPFPNAITVEVRASTDTFGKDITRSIAHFK